MRVIPDLPASALSQASWTLLPMGQTMPRPVTTTRLRLTVIYLRADSRPWRAPRSSTNDESFLISASLTPSCSAMIFLTACSMFSAIDFSLKRGRILRHVHAAVDVQDRACDISGSGRREIGDGGVYMA